MRQSLFRRLVLVPAVFLFASGNGICAEAADGTENFGAGLPAVCRQSDLQEEDFPDGTQTNTVTDSEAYEDILDELSLAEMDQQLSQAGIDTAVPVSEMVSDLMRGDMEGFFAALAETVRNVLFGKLTENKNLMLELIGIVLIGSVFVNLSGSFGGLVSDNGFYITYMLMTSLLLTSFSMAVSVTMDALEKMLIAVRVFVPAFLLILRFVGQTVSANGTYSLMLLAIWMIQAVIIRFVMPLIEFYVIVSMVNHLQREDSFSKLCELVHSIVKWILRTIIAVVIGGSVIKGLLEPQMDAIGKTAVNRMLSALPQGTVSVFAGTYLACGMVIKNSIGIAGILILSFLCLLPLLQLFLLMFTVQATTALIQPLGDKRFMEGTAALSRGISMLMQTLASALCLFVIMLAIMAAATNGGG